jgi:hypothetical protein
MGRIIADLAPLLHDGVIQPIRVRNPKGRNKLRARTRKCYSVGLLTTVVLLEGHLHTLKLSSCWSPAIQQAASMSLEASNRMQLSKLQSTLSKEKTMNISAMFEISAA